ncbi:MAG: glycoside hydrolase family 9 protein [Chitinophagaceae bacterium]
MGNLNLVMKQMLSLLLLLPTCITHGQQATEAIRLNQVGFYNKLPKVAAIAGATKHSIFYLVHAGSTDTVFEGRLSEERRSVNSSLVTRLAEFSSFQKEGRYFIDVPGLGRSYTFEIGKEVYRTAAIALLKGFYFQRSNQTLTEPYAGKWNRGAGHPDTAIVVHPSAASTKRPAGTVIASPGGWYDAGDYNKYIVNSGITMHTLLSAYEDFPVYFRKLKTQIPESSDGIPDVLNEVLYNLRWMLTMQDPADGGVYHKCTNAGFDGMVMPGVTKAPRYVVQKSTAATLDFAAVMAQAARVYKPYYKELPGLADSCLSAATYAWNWSVRNPDIRYDQDQLNSRFQPKITTGAYGDRRLRDEWLWAAAELFATTTQKAYFDTVVQHRADPVVLPSWADVGMLAYYTLARQQMVLPGYARATVAAMKDSILRKADNLANSYKHTAFHTTMGLSPRDFVWGSNAVAANGGILLLQAYLFTKQQKYLEGALSSADYLLGRNATGYCFITGIGTKSPRRPHHRPSVADGVAEPVPGLLAGGPNPGRQDSCAYTFIEPETAYTDLDCSYASNEIAINWNAPAAYLLNAVEALQLAGRTTKNNP